MSFRSLKSMRKADGGFILVVSDISVVDPSNYIDREVVCKNWTEVQEILRKIGEDLIQMDEEHIGRYKEGGNVKR